MAAKRKIDTDELVKWMHATKPDGKKYTQTEIADKLGVTLNAVAKRKAMLSPALLAKRSVQEYRDARADILAEFQQTLLRSLTPEKINKASVSQIVTCMAILYDKEQLERGKATQNIAVNVKIESLDDEDRQKMKDLIKDLTEKRLAEARQDALEENY